MASRGYSGYRGRTPLWKKLTALGLLLVIVLALGFVALQDRMVYGDDGSIYLDLPWREEAPAQSAPEGGASPEAGPELNITVEEAGLPRLTAAELSGDPAAWAAELAALDREGRAAVVTLRASGGALEYPFAAAGNIPGTSASGRAEAVAAALPDVVNGERRAVARLSCLRDGATARANLEDMGLKNTGGFIFYDGNNENWLDPSKPATVEYLCALAGECAGLGFDEILLTDLTYPTVGKLDKVDDRSADRAAALAELAAAVKEAVGEDVCVGVELSAAVLSSGADETAGQSLARLAQAADRVYAPTAAAEAPALAAAVAAANEDADFVAEVTDAAGVEGSYLLLTP